MVAQWEKEVVIQEWIQGGDERIAFCLTFYDDNSEQAVSFPGRKLRQWAIRCGNTAMCEPSPREWAEGISRLTETIFKKVRFKGLGSIEYKIRPDSNVPVTTIIHLTSRYWTLTYRWTQLGWQQYRHFLTVFSFPRGEHQLSLDEFLGSSSEARMLWVD